MRRFSSNLSRFSANQRLSLALAFRILSAARIILPSPPWISCHADREYLKRRKSRYAASN